MKVIVAGPRWVRQREYVEAAMNQMPWVMSELVSGHCPTGVDYLAEQIATKRGIRIKRYTPMWQMGKRAGPERNQRMVDYADAAVVLMPVGAHPMKGTIDLLNKAVKAKLKVYVYSFDGEPGAEPV